IEFLNGWHPDDIYFVFRGVRKLRSNHQYPVPPSPVFFTKRLHRTCHTSHMRGEGVGSKNDIHNGLLSLSKTMESCTLVISGITDTYPGKRTMAAGASRHHLQLQLSRTLPSCSLLRRTETLPKSVGAGPNESSSPAASQR